MTGSPNDMALALRRLRLRHLEVLHSIAQHGSLTAAADAMGVTQPAVSQWLADIESAIGLKLFTRGRQIHPTIYLAPVLWHARRMINDSHRLADELHAISAGDAGLVRIGAMQVAGPRLMPQAILALRAQGAGVRIELAEDIAAGLWPRFERRELDVLVTRLDGRAYAPDVVCEALCEDRHRVVAAKGHPLRRKRRISWDQTLPFPWIVPPAGTPLRRAIETSFVAQGLAPPLPWLESAALTSNLSLVAHTDALCVVSDEVAIHAQRTGEVVVLPLQLPTEIGPVGAVWHERQPTAAVARVLDALRMVTAWPMGSPMPRGGPAMASHPHPSRRRSPSAQMPPRMTAP